MFTLGELTPPEIGEAISPTQRIVLGAYKLNVLTPDYIIFALGKQGGDKTVKKAFFGGLAVIAILAGMLIGSVIEPTEASSYVYCEYGECYDDMHYH